MLMYNATYVIGLVVMLQNANQMVKLAPLL